MRIALVIERFEARGGGVEAVAFNVARELATGLPGRDEVHVFARSADADAERATGCEIHRLAVCDGWQPARVWSFSRAAAAATRRDRAPGSRAGFDIVQTFSRTRHQDVFRAGGGCHAAYMERAYSPAGRRWRRASPRHALALAIERQVFADPRQLILCNSEMVRDEIAVRHGVPDERLAVIVNGVELERFHPRHADAGAALRAHEPEARRLWLLVGSGFERKGLATALETLALRPADEVLWVAGADPPAPWRARADALGLSSRVRFLGRRDDLPALYAACDALLLPTRYDAFANVCLEAAASGRAVVTSACNGAATWLGEGGLVVADASDAGGFAAALEQLDSDEVRTRRGRAARARAETASWARHVEQLRECYSRWRP